MAQYRNVTGGHRGYFEGHSRRVSQRDNIAENISAYNVYVT